MILIQNNFHGAMMIMNEFSLLFHDLSQVRQITVPEGMKEYPIYGVTEDELLTTLHLTGQHARYQLLKLLNRFAHAITPFGLEIHQNPLNLHWFLRQSNEIQDFFQSSPFNTKPRLIATLTVIIALTLLEGHPVTDDQVENLRKKQSIQDDLRELIDHNFIQVHDSLIDLTPTIGYYVDFERFYNKLDELLRTPINQQSEKG